MVKYTEIKVDAPLAEAFRSVGNPGFATIISVGALIGLTTVMMILMLGQSRVFFAMSRDRLLPPVVRQGQSAVRHARPDDDPDRRRRRGHRDVRAARPSWPSWSTSARCSRSSSSRSAW